MYIRTYIYAYIDMYNVYMYICMYMWVYIYVYIPGEMKGRYSLATKSAVFARRQFEVCIHIRVGPCPQQHLWWVEYKQTIHETGIHLCISHRSQHVWCVNYAGIVFCFSMMDHFE